MTALSASASPRDCESSLWVTVFARISLILLAAVSLPGFLHANNDFSRQHESGGEDFVADCLFGWGGLSRQRVLVKDGIAPRRSRRRRERPRRYGSR